MERQVEVLTFDTESATQLGLIRNLGEQNIKIALASYKKHSLNASSKYVNEIIKVSDWNESPDSFIDELIDIGKKNKYRYMILAASDSINLLIARNFEVLKKSFFLPFKDEKIIETLINKELFYIQMQKMNVNIPKTFIPKNKDDIKKAKNIIGFPLIIKPKCMFDNKFHEYFNTKILKVFNEDEYEKIIDKLKSISKNIIIQRCISGNKNIGIYGYFYNGCFISCCVIDKDYLDEGGTTILGHNVENEKLKNKSEAILRTLKYQGFAELEFIYDDSDKEYKLLEINSRPVQWCRLPNKIADSIEAFPIKILEKGIHRIGNSNLNEKKHIYYEIGLVDLYLRDKINMLKIIMYLTNPEYISMFWDSKDLVPSIKYRSAFCKCLLHAVIKKHILKYT